MPKLKPGTIVPTQKEDKAISAGIAADPDSCEVGDAAFKHLKRMGRPPKVAPKVALTVRYDQDIIEAFKASGEGWQTRMNSALREWLQTHRTR